MRDGVDYSLPEPLTMTGQGPTGEGALVSMAGNNHFAGPVTIQGDTTIGVDGGTMSLTGGMEIPTAAFLTKGGPGTLSLAGNLAWGPASAITTTAGTLRIEPSAGSNISVSAVSPTLLIFGGAVQIDADGADPLTDSQDPSLHADVINDSPNGFVVEAGSVAVNQLIGGGTTYVADGAALTVNHIDQAGLSIGAGGIVTLQPGQGTSVLQSLNLGPVLDLSGESITGASDSPLLSPADAALVVPESSADIGVVGSAAVASVPEPSTMSLLVTVVVALVLAILRRRCIA
jgi:hypothetical protein